MALFYRDKTGEGQHVEGAVPTALMLSNAFLIERDLLGVDNREWATAARRWHRAILYRTSDGGWVLLQVAGAADVQAVVPPGRPRGHVRRPALR